MPVRTIRHSFGVMLAASALCGLALAVVGYVPTVRLWGSAGVTAMATAVAVSLAAGAAGAGVIASGLAGPTAKLPTAILGATCARFLLMLVLLTPLLVFEWVERTPLVVWAAFSYLVLLVVDTWHAVARVRGAQGADQ